MLSHEMGHWKLNHTVKNLIISQVSHQILYGFTLLQWLINKLLMSVDYIEYLRCVNISHA